MKLLTSHDLEMVIRHALAEYDRVSDKQPRKRCDAYMTGLWDGVRFYNEGVYDGEIESGDTLIVKVREAFIMVLVEKVCEKIIKCTDINNNYCVYPDAVLAILRRP